ncbi:NUDIX domain-containing protein [Paenibacillus aurantius]|uniref:NUDIX domain-containing protein n=1 Tax=Paenibacillus aurantius TaxID=2918900 RepID=A0AA96LJY1_9BACL|nr:NUDIX domain-containing protein [Paenibacillus aurantius]WNQ12827.1 NUDIX domain-containing protein [Paenibacillus aurantius]
MSVEWFDIYDEARRPIGKAPREEVHREGYWHQTFQCWILTREDGKQGEPCLLLQRRHPGKDTYPGLFDITAAGHLEAGEDVSDGIRELEEELGLAAAFGDLVPLGCLAEESFIRPGLTDREFCHVFLYACDQTMEAYRLQPEEVTGLIRVKLRELTELWEGTREKLTAPGVEAGPDGVLRSFSHELVRTDLVPHSDRYYRTVFEGVERFLSAP